MEADKFIMSNRKIIQTSITKVEWMLTSTCWECVMKTWWNASNSLLAAFWGSDQKMLITTHWIYNYVSIHKLRVHAHICARDQTQKIFHQKPKGCVHIWERNFKTNTANTGIWLYHFFIRFLYSAKWDSDIVSIAEYLKFN